jgi:hypothetical protein
VDKLVERYQGVADRVVMCFAFADWGSEPSSFARWSDVARDVLAPTT